MDGECPREKECIGRAADQGSAGEWKDSWIYLTSGNLSLVGLQPPSLQAGTSGGEEAETLVWARSIPRVQAVTSMRRSRASGESGSSQACGVPGWCPVLRSQPRAPLGTPSTWPGRRQAPLTGLRAYPQHSLQPASAQVPESTCLIALI